MGEPKSYAALGRWVVVHHTHAIAAGSTDHVKGNCTLAGRHGTIQIAISYLRLRQPLTFAIYACHEPIAHLQPDYIELVIHLILCHALYQRCQRDGNDKTAGQPQTANV